MKKSIAIRTRNYKTMPFHNHEEVERDGIWFWFVEQDNWDEKKVIEMLFFRYRNI